MRKIKEVMGLASYQKYEKDKIIYTSENEIDKMYIVTRGRIKIAPVVGVPSSNN